MKQHIDFDIKNKGSISCIYVVPTRKRIL